MAERRPFYFNGSTSAFSLRRMTDTNMALLRYNLRYAYAQVLNGNGNGRLYTGGGNNVGQAIDTERTQGYAQQARNNSGGEDWPGYPATGTLTRSTTTFTQTRSNATFPSAANLRDYGWLYWQGSTTSFNMRVISAEQDFVDTLLTDTISEAVSGDEVGTYRISTGSPGGGWTSKGGVFTNTIYSNNSQTTWNLYLKTSASDPAGENPVGYNGGFKVRDRSSGGSLVQTLLLPMLHRRVANNGALNYSINGSGTGRGTMTDTRYNSSSTNQWFTSNIYYRSRTPSGGQSNNSSYELKVKTS
jgi:hypothetical protein